MSPTEPNHNPPPISAMSPAHGGKAVAVPEDFSKTRVNDALIVALMFDDLSLNDPICFHNQRRSVLGLGFLFPRSMPP